MRNLLTKHGIPDTTLSNAVEFLSSAADSTVQRFIGEFQLSLYGQDALSAANFAADAIFRGATAVDKVVGYVAKRMTGQAVQAAPVAPERIVMVGAPVVDTEEVTIVPVMSMGEVDIREEVAPVLVVKGQRGRKRLGTSAFCKAVTIIEANPSADRQTIIDCIVAQGIKQASAAVYMWRYNKGERE